MDKPGVVKNTARSVRNEPRIVQQSCPSSNPIVVKPLEVVPAVSFVKTSKLRTVAPGKRVFGQVYQDNSLLTQNWRPK